MIVFIHLWSNKAQKWLWGGSRDEKRKVLSFSSEFIEAVAYSEDEADDMLEYLGAEFPGEITKIHLHTEEEIAVLSNFVTPRRIKKLLKL